MPAAVSFPGGVSREDVELLWVGKHKLESGYRNVYRKGRTANRVPVWHAKVKTGKRLRLLRGSTSTDPRECAAHVVLWYRAHFGEKWQKAVATRRLIPWRTKKDEERGGYLLSVWEFGRQVHVVRLLKRKNGKYTPWRVVKAGDFAGTPLGKLEVFRTPKEAHEYARVWLVRRYGLFAGQVAWVAGSPPA